MLNHFFGKQQQFRLALVTGASSGIGAALCRLLARKKIPLVMTGRDRERLDELAKDLQRFVPVSVVSIDLADREERRTLVDKIYADVPDLIVNSAGFGLYGDAVSFPSAEYVEMVDLNISALMELTLAGVKALASSGKQGVIMNISSASDLLVFPGFAVYAATKAFVTQFSQSLDVESRPRGVRVLVSCPGVVSTRFRQRAATRDDVQKGPSAMTVDFVAKQIWEQIASHKKIHYFGWKTRLMLILARYILPEAMVSKILYSKIKSLKRPYGSS